MNYEAVYRPFPPLPPGLTYEHKPVYTNLVGAVIHRLINDNVALGPHGKSYPLESRIVKQYAGHVEAIITDKADGQEYKLVLTPLENGK